MVCPASARWTPLLELALGLPAAGALAVTALRRRRSAALLIGLACGVAAFAAVIAGAGRVETPFGVALGLPPAELIVLVATFLAGAMAVVLSPGEGRLPMLCSVLAGLAAVAAMAVVVEPLLMVLVILLVACSQAVLPGLRPFSRRMRAPAFGALALGLGLVLDAGVDGPPLEKIAGLAVCIGFVAIIGLAPYLMDLDPHEPAPASPVAWLAFLGPGIAVAMAGRVLPRLTADAGAAYVVVLLALGVSNILLGLAGSFLARSGSGWWKYSFLGDWGLVLVGFALLSPASGGAAELLLLSLLLVRLPLYLAARPALAHGESGVLTAWRLVAAAALAGAAPFLGFPARLLLLRAATTVAWPLAAVLVLAMLAWLPQSVRLARTIERPSGSTAAVLALAGIGAVVLGLYPGPLLRFLGVP